jgi:CDP-paratose 2-epimerase
MNIAIITGSGGLIGSEAVDFFSNKFDKIIGIDNNLRQYFFGEGSSTVWNQERLQKSIPNYNHVNIDIRDVADVEKLFKEYGTSYCCPTQP